LRTSILARRDKTNNEIFKEAEVKNMLRELEEKKPQ
jgi:hypothetical protein